MVVITAKPLQQILQKVEMSGGLIWWTLELSEFDIEFQPRMVVKAQAIADFIAESIDNPGSIGAKEDTNNMVTWMLYADGSSNA